MRESQWRYRGKWLLQLLWICCAQGSARQLRGKHLHRVHIKHRQW